MNDDHRFFGHPRGLATLFFTELWERFSYYGMRGLLILFMVASTDHGGLGFPALKAGAIYGLYTGMVYLLGLPGGWIADQIIGARKAVLYGGIVIALGHFCLAFPSINTFYFGLVLITIGTGLLKPNVSTMVGQLYAQNDPRRDAGFSIFYMGINLGAFVAPLACSYLGEKVNWHYGFALAGIGMTAGLIQYVLGLRYLGDAGRNPAPVSSAREASSRKRNLVIGLAAAFTIVVTVAGLAATGALSVAVLSNAFGILLTTIVVALFGWLLFGGDWPPVDRKRLIAIFVLFVAACLFWSAYEQAGSTLSLFAERNTDRHWFNGFPAGWFQSLPALFVIMLAPLFAWIWVRLGTRNPSSAAKFSIGLLFAGLSFAILIPVALRAGVSPMWLTMTYLLQTLGEMCLSPVGLSAMTKLAPARVASLMMGVWFLADSIGNYISGRLASLYESFPLNWLFGIVAAFCILLGLGLALLVRPMKRLMGGVN